MSVQRITVLPGICGGQPTVLGMRITVSQVLALLAGGMSPAEILKDYPYLEQGDIDASLDYAARLAGHREVIPGG